MNYMELRAWIVLVSFFIIFLIIESILWFRFKKIKGLIKREKSLNFSNKTCQIYLYFLIVIGTLLLVILISSVTYVGVVTPFPKSRGVSRDTWVTFWGSIIGCTFGGIVGEIIAYKIMRYQLEKEKERLEDETEKKDLLREIEFCNKILFKYIFLKIEMKCCYDLYEKIGYFDIPENREWLISELGENNKQNKLRVLINLGNVDLFRVVKTVVNIVGYDKAREYLTDRKLFTRHCHEINNTANQLEYYCLLINKLENKNIDYAIIRYKLSIYNEVSEILYKLGVFSEGSYNYIQSITNINYEYSFKSKFITK